ncbi:YeeE/YedE family protein [Roseateles sp.]|uniref:YeeE/YedE family protein n=1 Tax=Roseateles sp. TaxID=1971397 RepID=UPI003BA6632E
MDISAWIDRFGTASLLMAGGALAGLLFGAAAQRSGLCTRAALLECWRGRLGERSALWLLTLAWACIGTQALVLLGWLQPVQSRLVGSPASVSGLLVGGALFGIGMVFTRGCPARLLVLTGGGNLRALLSLLVFGVVVQATLTGALVGPRQWVAELWRLDPGPFRDLGRLTGMGSAWAWLLGPALLASAWLLLRRKGVAQAEREAAPALSGAAWAASLAGLVIALAWAWTASIAAVSFDPVAVQSLNYSAPAAEWLQRLQLQAEFHPPLGLDTGLLPATLLGAWVATVLARQWRWQGYGPEHRVGANVLGAVLMGFGAVLAGGCTVGHGLSGLALGATSSVLALLGMAAGVGLGRWVAQRRGWPL